MADPTETHPTNGSPAPSGVASPSPKLPQAERVVVLRAYGEELARKVFAETHGLTFWSTARGEFMRDLAKIGGYLAELGCAVYRSRYERGGIAERIVEAAPKATWVGGADLVEDPDPGELTPFEEAAAALFERLAAWDRMERADILAGLGRYGVLLIGAPGEMDQELPRLNGPDAILYLTALAEDHAEVVKEVEDPKDPRFGLPEFYELNLGSGLTTKQRSLQNRKRLVHWTRILHVAEGLLEDDVCGKPRLRAAWNRLDDLEKILAGGSEATFRRADPGLHIDIPMFSPDGKVLEIEESTLAAQTEQIQNYIHGTGQEGLNRVLKTRGTSINQLTTQIPAFGGNADAIMAQISAITGIPLRILQGSERGELASSQDRSNWSDRVSERRGRFAGPLVRQLVDRLVQYGALPTPEEYEVAWPEMDELGPGEQAEVAAKLATANLSQFQAGLPPVATSNEIRDRVLKYGPIEEIEGFEDVESGQGVEPPENRLQAAKLRVAVRRGLIRRRPEPAAQLTVLQGGARPELRAIHRAADSNVGKVSAVFLSMWLATSAAVDANELEAALARNNRMAAERVMISATQATEAEWAPKVEAVISATLTAGGEAAVRSARGRGAWLRAAAEGGTFRAAAFEASFDAVDPRALAWARDHSSQLIVEISEETRAAVRELIASGISEGIPPAALSRQIREVVGLRPDQLTAVANLERDLRAAKPGSLVSRFPPAPTLRNQPGFRVRIPKGGLTEAQLQAKLDKYREMQRNLRARTIARTETMNAANQGQSQAWAQAVDKGQLPRNQKRVWITAGDSAVRDEHAALGGEVVGLEESFSGGFEPGEEPNCRCVAGLATAEDLERSGLVTAPQQSETISGGGILQSGEIQGFRRLPGTGNDVRRVFFRDPGSGDRASGYWKPNGSQLGPAGGTLGDREILAKKIDDILGTNLVPDTVRRGIGGIDGTVQATAPGEAAFRFEAKFAKDVMASIPRQSKVDMSLFDIVIGNADRHAGNALVTEGGRLSAIDHGFSFLHGRQGSLSGLKQQVTARWWAEEGIRLTSAEKSLWLKRLDSQELIDAIRDSPISDAAKSSAMRRISALKKRIMDDTLGDYFSRLTSVPILGPSV